MRAKGLSPVLQNGLGRHITTVSAESLGTYLKVSDPSPCLVLEAEKQGALYWLIPLFDDGIFHQGINTVLVQTSPRNQDYESSLFHCRHHSSTLVFWRLLGGRIGLRSDEEILAPIDTGWMY